MLPLRNAAGQQCPNRPGHGRPGRRDPRMGSATTPHVRATRCPWDNPVSSPLGVGPPAADRVTTIADRSPGSIGGNTESSTDTGALTALLAGVITEAAAR